MKKILIGILAMACAGISFANDGIAHSSFTATNDTNLLMRSDTSTNTIVHTLTAVVVSSATAGGVLKIYNSTFSAVNPITFVDLGTVGVRQFFDIQVKGIFYTTTGNSNGVSIIYKQ